MTAIELIQKLTFSLTTGLRVKVPVLRTVTHRDCTQCPGHPAAGESMIVVDGLSIEEGGRSGYVVKYRVVTPGGTTAAYCEGYWRVAGPTELIVNKFEHARTGTIRF